MELVAFAPNLKIMLCVGLGYIIVKQGIFVPASAKGVSILAMVSGLSTASSDSTDCQNIGLPALIFSSMVSAFTPENISAFGSLVVVAILYQVLGVSLAWCVREFFNVPTDFRWGILVVSPARSASAPAHYSWALRRTGVNFIDSMISRMLMYRKLTYRHSSDIGQVCPIQRNF
jgi:predicted permease